MFLIILLSIAESIQGCAPIFSRPSFTPVNSFNPAGGVVSPSLPETAFQMDNMLHLNPTNEDYENSDALSVQRDTILPFEKSKLHFSLFDLFRPLALATPAPTVPAGLQSTNLVFMNVSFSPPVHWTYCDPICGVGDQAVDSENAYENARDDVVEAVKSSCNSLNIKCDYSSIDLKYHPESVLTEEFGSYYDLNGNRYRISGKTIAFRINNQNPGLVQSFVLPMKIEFKTVTPVDQKTVSAIRQKTIDYLAARKFLHISTTSSI